MTPEVASARETQTLGQAVAELHVRGEALPDHTERLFVVDARNILEADPSASTRCWCATRAPSWRKR